MISLIMSGNPWDAGGRKDASGAVVSESGDERNKS
jgi:hypothetical protein